MRNLACLIVLGVLAGPACRNNPYDCEGSSDNDCRAPDAGQDAEVGCGVCAAPTPVCDLAGSRTCVECTPEQSGACTGARPVCGAGHVCQSCAAHAECPSAACLPDGACALETDVAYVDPAGTDNAACTAATPCTLVAKALATSRPYLKLRGTTNEAVVIADRNVTILAEPGAILTSFDGRIVLEIRGTSRVAIHGLEIGGTGVNSGIGLSMPAGGAPEVTLVRTTVINHGGGGVLASAGTLIARRSVFLGNPGGGISLAGAQFDLQNNVIARNGSLSSFFGGILVSQISAGLRRLEFNTITQNLGKLGLPTGVTCAVISPPITFSNNIVYGNHVDGADQVGTMGCIWTYSNIGPGGFAGPGNIDINPQFVDVVRNDFHLAPGSPVIDLADPAATLATDLDGDARPHGAGRDIGADERVP